MFRGLRTPSKMLNLSRLPLSVYSKAKLDPNVVVHRVRFKRPWRPRIVRTLKITAFLYVSMELISFSLDKVADELGLDEEEDETDRAKNGDGEDEEDEDEEDGFFIPFPGTTKTIGGAPYKGTDPEWQEFIRLSRDQKLLNKVRHDLASLVLALCEKSNFIVMRSGPGMKIRQFWFDIDFPYRPPPEFERSGIEITSTHIAWVTMPVDSLTVSRLRRYFWPSAATLSMWTFSKALFSEETRKLMGIVAKDLGTKPLPWESAAQNPANGKSQTKTPSGRTAASNGLPGLTPDPSATASAPSSGAVAATDNNNEGTADPSSKAVVQPPPGGKAATPGQGQGQEDPNSTIGILRMNYVKIVSGAIQAFHAKFSQLWKWSRPYPPRGSILVSGLIELDASRANIVIDVKAAFWDPKTRDFDPHSMQLELRRIQAKTQAPAQG